VQEKRDFTGEIKISDPDADGPGICGVVHELNRILGKA